MGYLFWDYMLVASMVVLLALAALFRKVRIAALLAAVVVCAEFLSPTLVNWDRNAGPATGPVLKVISYNWLLDERDRSDIYAWLKHEDPDIVAIQEFTEQEKGTTALFSLFPYHTTPVPDVLILSKYPIIKQTNKSLDWNSMVRAEINVKNRLLVVWGIHPATLKEPQELKARDHYLSDIAYYAARETEPVLMLGDFNATRWDPGFRAIVAAGELHEEPALLAPLTRMAVRKGVPFIGAPIDHLLTNGSNIFSDCHTGPNLGSDHKPLVCILQLSR
ncbi:endonuclease/exonuclease/phosphatase family protein [Rhizobium sp. C4]|uniref:endonuclease/exonuclease/phosphatase family protein n=1 Tax=Rhizobium sp. C4 TaxID=1349800 RepID=UPI001E5B7E3C|nr:endonuclease/exonuclease/phosphatase family protein [Rhizobium sp. C4]MCD2173497.1 endonuclease/exonuclease/phosphatase family protein [Rhizobium sp. C4]